MTRDEFFNELKETGERWSRIAKDLFPEDASVNLRVTHEGYMIDVLRYRTDCNIRQVLGFSHFGADHDYTDANNSVWAEEGRLLPDA